MRRGAALEAVRDFQQFLQLQPGSAEGYFNLGLALQSAGQLQDALAALHKAASFEPTLRGLLLFTGIVDYKLNHLAAAHDELNRETKLDPKNAATWMWFGIVELAQNRADAAKRESDLQKAEADLAKAELQLRKGPLLSEIDRLKNEAKADDARAHVASLKKSNGFHDQADAAAVHILELQRDRQKVSLDRALSNAEKLEIHATLDGMAALENVWRNGTMGKPQEGDQLWPSQPLIRIFDPSEMEVLAQVGEPDDAALAPESRAVVRLDAYPELALEAHFISASPVASSAIGSPIKTFTARFRLEKSDPHLLPDLSAAVVLDGPASVSGGGR